VCMVGRREKQVEGVGARAFGDWGTVSKLTSESWNGV